MSPNTLNKNEKKNSKTQDMDLDPNLHFAR